MKQSSLHSLHKTLGARLESIGEWEMPAHYGDPVAEHLAVRKTVGIADPVSYTHLTLPTILLV